MDHLLTPRQPLYELVEVPYVCNELDEYDGGPLETYPARKGWQDLTHKTPNLEGIVQTWLFFGFLTTFFGERTKVENWTCSRENPRRTVVTTQKLPQLAARWIDQQRTLDEASSEKRSLEIKATVLFVSRMISSLYSLSGNALDRRIILSIELLGEFLQSTSFRAYGTRRMPDWRSHSVDEVSWVNHGNLAKSILYERLRSDGWCPYELAMLKTKFPGSGLYFFSNLDRPGARKDHRKCTESKCFTYQLNQERYRTRHVEHDCNCLEVVDDRRLVHSILRGGSYPIISLTAEGTSENLSIVEAVPNMKYVAISHVWSDGLGNLRKNALPRCQLRRLSRLVSNTFEYIGEKCPPLFWVDTVCCPPEDGEAQDLALSRMRDTYQKASCVLVLDSWLENQSIEALSECEIMMRITCCGWNRRLWTFQEGALAQSLVFKFADSLFDLDNAISQIYHDEDVVFDLTLKTSIVKNFLDARSFRNQDIDTTLRIKTIMSSLKFRATSVASDEALCLGVMLNVDVMRILQASTNHEERMAKLWSLVSEVPAELAIFDGRRLTSENFRWAPATLLSPVNHGWGALIRYSRGQNGKITPDGLTIQFPGFVLPCPSGTIFRVFHFKEEETKTWYEVCCYRILTSKAAIQNEEDGAGLSVEGKVKLQGQRNPAYPTQLALITQVPIGRPEIPTELRSSGILATITRKGDGIPCMA
jgi:hypothetical protein